MWTLTSRVAQNLFQYNKSCESSITTRYQSEISKIYICLCLPSSNFFKSFMNSLFIVYKNEEWYHFVVRIRSPTLISFYCVCVVCFYICLYSFQWSLLLAEVSLLILTNNNNQKLCIFLSILLIKQQSCSQVGCFNLFW